MKKFTLIVLIIHAQFFVMAQNYFQKIYGGANDENFWNVEKTADNNFLLLGHWFYDVTCNLQTFQEANLYCIKIDTNGELLNQVNVISNQDKEMVYADEISPGEYFMIGNLWNLCWYDQYFGYMHVNSNGEILDQGKYYSFPGYGEDGAKVKTNEYILVGKQSVLKVSSAGDSISSKIISLPAGYTWMNLTRVAVNPITHDIAIYGDLTPDGYFLGVCLDENLTVKWEKVYSMTEYGRPYGLTYTSSNDILIVGSLFSSESEFILKLNASGDSLWYHTYFGGDSIYLHSISEIPVTRDIVTAGYYTTDFSSFSSYDGYFMRVDSNGTFINSERIGGNQYDVFEKARATNPSSVYLFGTSASYYANKPDFYIVKTDANGFVEPITGINEKHGSGMITVTPNPFTNELSISTLGNLFLKNIRIYNEVGAVVYEKKNVNSPKRFIFNPKLRSGIYFYIVGLSDGSMAKGKIIKE